MKKKKHELKARVRYDNSENGEGYAVEILTNDGEWSLDSYYHLVKREYYPRNDFIHWTILKKLAELQNMGYKVELPW